MTTAARPTFDTARGGTGTRERDLSALSKQYSARDLPSHTSLKSRDRGQSNPDDVAGRDFRRELEERERAVREKDSNKRDSSSSVSGSSVKKPRVDAGPAAAPLSVVNTANLDADDPIDDSEVESDSDDDSDDDTAALMAELQKIKREKAAEEREKEEQRKQEEERIRMENILSGNPLLRDKYAPSSAADKTDMKVKRRWDDDVVFKNCSRAEPDKKEKAFINDSLRSEFHRKFMDKYIK